MLRIVTGPFHPDLEQALVDEVRTHKAADPLTPLTIIAPSESLRRRLTWLLCAEHRCALLDVRFQTFYQFAIRLLEDSFISDPSFDPPSIHPPAPGTGRAVSPGHPPAPGILTTPARPELAETSSSPVGRAVSPGPPGARVRSGFFFRELVHQLLRRDAHRADWATLVDMPGAWGALLATLKDLKDAGVTSEGAGEALSHRPDGSMDLRALVTLYRAFLDEKERMQVLDQDDVAVLAEPCVANSPFLSRQGRILYYGFYDLTQVQLDLFRSVARAYPTTLFFPLIKGHADYTFAERFFERHVYGLGQGCDEEGAPLGKSRSRPARGWAGEKPAGVGGCDEGGEGTGKRGVRQLRYGSARPGDPWRIVSVSGPVDEVTFVAKDILGLVEDRGYAFREIGVVARSLTGYETLLPRIFTEHAIPFSSKLGRSLYEFPFVKAVIQLLAIRVGHFRRDQVIAFLASPFVRIPGHAPAARRIDQWDLASRRLGITKGIGEWQRLALYQDRDLPLGEIDEEAEEITGARIPARHVHSLWETVSALAASLQELPDTATWDAYCDRVQAFAEEWLDPAAGEAALSDDDAVLIETFESALEELRRLRDLSGDVTLDDFTAAFHRLMEETALPIGPRHAGGVHVLDAMGARGVPFRALYVLGLNEKVFPRHIREDAFLRDPPRRVLDADLGFKIQEKLAGYDEERLLFSLLCRSAGERLTLLCQRADQTGRPLVASSYVAELQRQTGIGEHRVPRRLARKLRESPQYQPDRLTVPELASKWLLERRVPRRLLQECHPAGRLVERGLAALSLLDEGRPSLGRHDGITGALHASWQNLKAAGVSPSGLQEYATCPFRYFAKQILRLRPPAIPEGIDQVGPLEIGTLVHAILRGCFETLRAQGYFAGPSRRSVDPAEVLEEVAHREFERFAATHPVGYPLLWTLHQERLLSFLRAVLQDDLDEMNRHGWEAVLFETDMTGRVTVPGQGGQAEEIAVTGRLDRIDWRPAQEAYRIVDYKFKSAQEPKPLDKNLTTGAVRAARLQPPLYLAMGPAIAAALPNAPAGARCAGVWFYYLAPQWDQPLTRVSFPGDAWTSNLQGPMTHAIGQVVSGIREGRFFIYPSGSCDWCDYRLLCRKNHQPTAWRARADHALVGPYRSLRKAVPPKSGSGDQPDEPE